MIVSDIILYYGGALCNDDANEGLPFKGLDIKCCYTQIHHRLKTLSDLKMIIMEELGVNSLCMTYKLLFIPHMKPSIIRLIIGIWQ